MYPVEIVSDAVITPHGEDDEMATFVCAARVAIQPGSNKEQMVTGQSVCCV